MDGGLYGRRIAVGQVAGSQIRGAFRGARMEGSVRGGVDRFLLGGENRARIAKNGVRRSFLWFLVV